mmetsp:Transcript_99172/g.265206  ORF Transcript_99172/g.265206 Transcript_99172/m.265206 type:complete len:501 (+) Transcript_99172:152-1654(+)
MRVVIAALPLAAGLRAASLRNIDNVRNDNDANTTDAAATAATTVSTARQAAISTMIDKLGVSDQLPSLKEAEESVPIEAVMASLASKVPDDVLRALAHTKTKTGAPVQLSAEEVASSRTVINGLIYSAQQQLDMKLIQCKEAKEKVTATKNMLDADLSRLGSKLAKEKKRIIAASAGVEDANKKVKNARANLLNHQKKCERSKNFAQAALNNIRQDLQSAETVVKVTECSSLLQVGRTQNVTGWLSRYTAGMRRSVRHCASYKEAALQLPDGQIVTFSTPVAISALQRSLRILNVDNSSTTPEDDDFGFDIETQQALADSPVPQLDEASASQLGDDLDKVEGPVFPEVTGFDPFPKPGKCTKATTQVSSKDRAKCAEDCSTSGLCKGFFFNVAAEASMCEHFYTSCTNTSADFDSSLEVWQGYSKAGEAVGDMPKIGAARAQPPAAKQANKCVMGDADCGVLNDNMSVFLGNVSPRQTGSAVGRAHEVAKGLRAHRGVNQ